MHGIGYKILNTGGKRKGKKKKKHDSYGYGEAYLIVMKTFIISHHSCAAVVMKDNFNISELKFQYITLNEKFLRILKKKKFIINLRTKFSFKPCKTNLLQTIMWGIHMCIKSLESLNYLN